MSDHAISKRKFLKTTAYVAPAILTLAVAPSFAQTGSGGGNNNNQGGNNNNQGGNNNNQ